MVLGKELAVVSSEAVVRFRWSETSLHISHIRMEDIIIFEIYAETSAFTFQTRKSKFLYDKSFG
jgi:hypothetical protein